MSLAKALEKFGFVRMIDATISFVKIHKLSRTVPWKCLYLCVLEAIPPVPSRKLSDEEKQSLTRKLEEGAHGFDVGGKEMIDLLT